MIKSTMFLRIPSMSLTAKEAEEIDETICDFGSRKMTIVSGTTLMASSGYASRKADTSSTAR